MKLIFMILVIVLLFLLVGVEMLLCFYEINLIPYISEIIPSNVLSVLEENSYVLFLLPIMIIILKKIILWISGVTKNVSKGQRLFDNLFDIMIVFVFIAIVILKKFN